jgi:hypothetical protein
MGMVLQSAPGRLGRGAGQGTPDELFKRHILRH